MKTKLILGGFLALANLANAQWQNGTNMYNLNSGFVGIGNGSAFVPGNKLHVVASHYNGGISIEQSAGGAAGLYLNNAVPGGNGHQWSIFSTNDYYAGVAMGGNLSIYDCTTSKDRFFIQGNNGYTGIGTIAPTAKLEVNETVTPPGTAVTFKGIRSRIYTQGNFQGLGQLHTIIGVEGISESQTNSSCYATGVYGKASNSAQNVGGDFYAIGNAWNYYNIAVHGSASGHAVPGYNFGAWFDGTTYCTSGIWNGSDRKLKTNIKTMTGALDKIQRLNPCTYTFKTDEAFKDMQLPVSNQMGLIAQELEEVFPDLVMNMPEVKKYNEKGEVVFNTPEFKSVQYTSLIPVLISGIKEQQQQIAELKNEVASLRSEKATGINTANTGAMNDFALDQNIPNPFSQETVIKYNLPQQVSVASLVVYDLSGKQVASFPITEKGASSITLTSEKLVAGIYIYSVMADGKILDSKRMVVAQK